MIVSPPHAGWALWSRLVILLVLTSTLALVGCDHKTAIAIVTNKERIPPAPKTREIRDERQVDHERWMVYLQMEDGGKIFFTDVSKEQWDSLKVGDRVRARYSEGQYSHTIWSAELEKL